MAEIDKIIHQPVRLQIVSALHATDSEDRFDFSSLKKMLGLTDGNLGAHLQKLEEAQYVEIEKIFEQRKPKTYVTLTPLGRKAFKEHVKALKEIIG